MQTFPLSKLKDTEHTKAKVDNLITETDRVLKLYPSLWPTPLKKKKKEQPKVWEKLTQSIQISLVEEHKKHISHQLIQNQG